MSDEPIERAMRDLCDELFAAHQRLDAPAIKRLYAMQPDGIYFWERALVYDYDQIATTIDAISSSVAGLTLTPGEFRAGGSGDAGWFAVTFHATRTLPDGRTFELDGRFTTIASLIDGRWQIVHDHASIPLPQKPWEH
jgi:ketosteroid isomerase-like protein